MSTLDIILLILLITGAVKGYKNGFIIESFSFLAFFIGLFVALELTIPISLALFEGSSFFDLGAIGIFIALFVILTILVNASAKAFKKAIDMTLLGSVDNLFGAFAGIFKWVFVVSILIWVLDSVGFEIADRYAANTIILPYIVQVGPVIFGWIGEVIPFVQDLIDSMDQLPERGSTYMTVLEEKV